MQITEQEREGRELGDGRHFAGGHGYRAARVPEPRPVTSGCRGRALPDERPLLQVAADHCQRRGCRRREHRRHVRLRQAPHERRGEKRHTAGRQRPPRADGERVGEPGLDAGEPAQYGDGHEPHVVVVQDAAGEPRVECGEAIGPHDRAEERDVHRLLATQDRMPEIRVARADQDARQSHDDPRERLCRHQTAMTPRPLGERCSFGVCEPGGGHAERCHRRCQHGP